MYLDKFPLIPHRCNIDMILFCVEYANSLMSICFYENQTVWSLINFATLVSIGDDWQPYVQGFCKGGQLIKLVYSFRSLVCSYSLCILVQLWKTLSLLESDEFAIYFDLILIRSSQLMGVSSGAFLHGYGLGWMLNFLQIRMFEIHQSEWCYIVSHHRLQRSNLVLSYLCVHQICWSYVSQILH